jgi:hypothetical protein
MLEEPLVGTIADEVDVFVAVTYEVTPASGNDGSYSRGTDGAEDDGHEAFDAAYNDAAKANVHRRRSFREEVFQIRRWGIRWRLAEEEAADIYLVSAP